MRLVGAPSFSGRRRPHGRGLDRAGLYARVFALKAQDRVIRLEMRLRMKELLPPALQPRVNEFAPGQLVAMRFASDAELPDLARQVLDGNVQDKKTIKAMIKDWQADYLPSSCTMCGGALALSTTAQHTVNRCSSIAHLAATWPCARAHYCPRNVHSPL